MFSLVWNDIGENDDEYDDGGVHGVRGDGLQIEDYHNDEVVETCYILQMEGHLKLLLQYLL